MLEKTSEKKKRSLKKNSKNSNKEVSKKLKPWERKNPWDDANDHKEIWKHENILSLKEKDYPKFTLAKNKARFYRMISWYKSKWEWLDIAPLSGTRTLLKQQKKELSDIRTHKLDYEWDLEMGTLTPSQQFLS